MSDRREKSCSQLIRASIREQRDGKCATRSRWPRSGEPSGRMSTRVIRKAPMDGTGSDTRSVLAEGTGLSAYWTPQLGMSDYKVGLLEAEPTPSVAACRGPRESCPRFADSVR